jgi:hypothetical protein
MEESWPERTSQREVGGCNDKRADVSTGADS